MRIGGRVLAGVTLAGVVLGGSLVTPGVAAADEILPTGPNGVTYIRTESGRTLCGIQGDAVNCTVQFVNPPVTWSGDVANSVTLNQNGAFTYLAADLGMVDPIHTVHYDQTYIANGWAVEAFSDGTRFTNNHSNEGFWVSIDGVDSLGQM
ncbi:MULTISPECIES: hypothetical protein [unclassified Mycolicibacterium]|uniref:hypothetical protein n=1 Tax=unclassified Mycolicibacterium TaxID=2636767 RepID=UPI0012DF62F1|nr:MULTISPECIES: hypothetical protein [unclassified Mycolicibacterium]MUL84322.1 hypothetical protein [Mycolicibacterium sp. CBMA 329]MUL89612.1 hypothetical protein [Mycolicibacterium sp. CBMA 331]MUL99788.1 hypothetical protein [Mycolicibacterium sp. CBMA 334]MUM29573.1 hypothetical protein [Mycolicibacterium sp. CBMA 295]MUM39127.1 hypothetical protein [Mycolicibacterium sp. CBMA 247]